MRLAIKIAGVAGGMLLPCSLPGAARQRARDRGPVSTMAAGTRPPASGRRRSGHRAGLHAWVYAIEHHITVRRKPAPCQGLSKAEINQAAARAIIRVAGGVPKADLAETGGRGGPVPRPPVHRARPVAGSLPAGPSLPGRGQPLGRKDLGMDIAALDRLARYGGQRRLPAGQLALPRRHFAAPRGRHRLPAGGDHRALRAGPGRAGDLGRVT